MIYIYMLFFALLSVAAPALAGDRGMIPFEHTEEGKVALPLIVDMLSNQPSNKDEIYFYVTPLSLCYPGRKYTNLLEQKYGKEHKINEPCVRVYYPVVYNDTNNLKKQFIIPFNAIPLRYFFSDNTIKKENNVLKSKQCTLCFFMAQDGNSNKSVFIKLAEDLKVTMHCKTDDDVLAEMLKRFEEHPCPWFLSSVDQEALQEELIADGICVKKGEKFVHGPNGYFSSPEYETIQKSPSYFSFLKNNSFILLSVGGLFAIYALCKHFYK